jgi:lysophospholipase L1-like esterase
MNRLRNVALACVVYLCLDLGLAQLLRGTTLWDSIALERGYRVSVQPYHHGLIPNVDVGAVWGGTHYHMRTNSLGFRDAVVRTIPLHSASPRAILIGDSFTEGLGVAYEQTYASLLTTCFATRGIQVLNAGVMSYSPSIYYRKLKYLLESQGLTFDYVIVAIDLSDIGDEARRYETDARGRVVSRPDSGPVRPGDNLKVLLTEHSLLLHVIHQVRASVYASRADPSLYSDWTNDSHAFHDYGAVGVRLAVERMDSLVGLLRRRGIGLAIVVYPYPGEIARRDSTSLQVRVWRKWASDHAVPFFDLFPAFLSYGPAPATVADNFIPHDVHWNPRGHQLVARTLLRDGLADSVNAYLTGKGRAVPGADTHQASGNFGCDFARGSGLIRGLSVAH